MATPGEEAEKALGHALRGLKTLGCDDQANINLVVARNVVQEEIGFYGKEGLASFELDNETLCRLARYGREDVAHSLINTIDILKIVSRAFKISRVCLILILLSLAIQICEIFGYFPLVHK